MSIWTKPLFGTERPKTPATNVAIRCARIRDAASHSTWPAMFIGYCVGKLILFFGLIGIPLFGLGLPGPNLLLAVREFGTKRIPGLMITITLPALAVWLWPRFSRFAFDRNAHRLTRENLLRHRLSRRRSRRTLIRLVMAIALILTLCATFGGPGYAMLMAAMFASLSGGILIGHTLFARQGARLVCARCEYPMITWRGAPNNCPECGCQWKEPWGARFGYRRLRLRYILLGLALIAISPALIAAAGYCLSFKS